MDVTRERWQAIKAEVKKTWSRLTDEELDRVDGDFTALEGLLQQKYGLSPEVTRTKLEELTAEFRRELKREAEIEPPPVDTERDGVRGTLRDQFRQF